MRPLGKTPKALRQIISP